VLAVTRMRRPKKAISPELAIQKIMADAKHIVLKSGRRLTVKRPPPDQVENWKKAEQRAKQQTDKRRADARAARTIQARELFASICKELGLGEARQIFKNAQRGRRARKDKHWPNVDAQIDFALSVYYTMTGEGPLAIARKFADDLGMSVPALEKRIHLFKRKFIRIEQTEN
jgi:hypothetical protein